MPGSVSFLKQLSGREAWKSTSSRWGGTSKYSAGESCGNGGCEGSLKQMEGLNMYGGDDHQNVGGSSVMRKRVMVVVDQSSHSKHALMWALNYVANKGDFLTLLHIIPAAAFSKGSERAAQESSSCSPYLANSLGSLCKACRPEVRACLCLSTLKGSSENFVCMLSSYLFGFGVDIRINKERSSNGYCIFFSILPFLSVVDRSHMLRIKKESYRGILTVFDRSYLVEVETLVIRGPKLATVMSQVKKLEVSVLVLGQKKQSVVISCLCGTSSTEEFVEQCINNAECLTLGVRKQSRGMGGYLISTRWQKNFWLLA
ncbi:hypothetical protein I3842_06G029800 [Carya illinoinensis]|uniref:UspA domain-containing protein n=1 Tax=Carya illinoinensis TaxID=32201 RepID=A0A922ER94_CARIL|nr:hypothetical protein I3842_06G029800 [Carya illinoinensis]